MRGRLCSVIAIVVVATAVAGARQDPMSAAAVRARLIAYLSGYEQALGQLIATEDLTQWPIRSGLGEFIGANAQTYRDVTRAHRLVSDVAFVPLPGNAGWLGFRDVRRVKNKEVSRRGPSLTELLATPTDDARARARALLLASARHNLGAPRTINLPSLPLELLHERNEARFVIDQSEPDRMNDCASLRIHLVETVTPTLIQRPEGGNMPSQVTAWVEPASGALCRAEVRTRDAQLGAGGVDAVVHVDFTYDPALDLRVPSKMYEEFLYPPRSVGVGEATYSNYRRFTTSARVLPPDRD